MDQDLPPLERLVDRRHTDRRNALIAATVVAALVFLTVVASIYGLVNVNRSLERRADRLAAQLNAQQSQTNCIRDLTRDLNDADVNNSLAFNRYVIGLGQRGDIAALTVELDAAGLALQGARDAYVAQNCPGG